MADLVGRHVSRAWVRPVVARALDLHQQRLGLAEVAEDRREGAVEVPADDAGELPGVELLDLVLAAARTLTLQAGALIVGQGVEDAHLPPVLAVGAGQPSLDE